MTLASFVEEDEMAFSQENQQWIRDEINKALNPPSWKRAGANIVAFGSPIAICALIVSLLAVMAGALYQSFAHIKEETEFRTRTTDRLIALDGTLTDIQASIRTLQAPQSPGKILKQIAPLPPKAFIQNLPALRVIAEQPPANVGSDNPTLHEIAMKLLGADEHTPDYWPTILQFIKFARSSVSGSKAPPPGRPNLVLSDVTTDNLQRMFGTIQNKIVLLDSVNLVNGHFERCRIIFTDKLSVLRNVVFSDCVLEFPVSDNPTPAIRNASRTFLASNLRTVSTP